MKRVKIIKARRDGETIDIRITLDKYTSPQFTVKDFEQRFSQLIGNTINVLAFKYEGAELEVMDSK